VFNAITTDLVKSCELQLETQPPRFDLINVAVDGVWIAPSVGDTDGWEVDQSTTPVTIRIKGSICQRIETNGVQSVEVIYGCPTINVK